MKAVLNNTEVVAVKEIEVFDGSGTTLQKAEREIAILQSCRSSRIVGLVGASAEAHRIRIVTEFCEGGDLWHALRMDRGRTMSWYKG